MVSMLHLSGWKAIFHNWATYKVYIWIHSYIEFIQPV
jgi:hypothetical protein